ncbi:MAG: hypothetical protein JSR71_13000 [Proteobacteria bacterium]|nr:hypothetical protein [Pseudomonadota bacterium]
MTLLEHNKRIFNEMALPVQVCVIFASRFSVFSWRDCRLHDLRSRLLNDGVTIVALAGD